jgi:predicted AlkP superfamily pyrophosphatase or phosphodiesterase
MTSDAGRSRTLHHTDTFPGYDSDGAGPYWAECECGWEGARRTNRVFALVEAQRHEAAMLAAYWERMSAQGHSPAPPLPPLADSYTEAREMDE